MQPFTTTTGDIAITSGSIAAIPRDAWQSMLPGEPESWDFYAAVEDIPPEGFKLGAMAARRGDTIVGVAPLFQVHYRLDTPLQGRARQVTNWIHDRAPRLVSFPVIGIGSPMSDNCSLGFAPGSTHADCVQIFEAMLDHLKTLARANKSAMLAVKSLDRSADVLDKALSGRGYNRVTSVPLVMLDLSYRNLDDYLRSLRDKTGSYLRRKMRGAQKVRIEYRSSVAGIEEQVNALFKSTLAQSKVSYGDFQELHPSYFARILDGMGEKAQFMLCWQGEQLLSFQLSLISKDRVLAKQIGMKYPEARELNLYFVNWLKLIEYAIDHRIPSIEMGATTYATKLLFGGHLERRWLHFRFRGAVANRLLGPLARFFDFERNDPELKLLDPASTLSMGPRMSRLEHTSKG